MSNVMIRRAYKLLFLLFFLPRATALELVHATVQLSKIERILLPDNNMKKKYKQL